MRPRQNSESVPMSSFSVSVPTMKTRFAFAPVGVMRYWGEYWSCPSFAWRFDLLILLRISVRSSRSYLIHFQMFTPPLQQRAAVSSLCLLQSALILLDRINKNEPVKLCSLTYNSVLQACFFITSSTTAWSSASVHFLCLIKSNAGKGFPSLPCSSGCPALFHHHHDALTLRSYILQPSHVRRMRLSQAPCCIPGIALSGAEPLWISTIALCGIRPACFRLDIFRYRDNFTGLVQADAESSLPLGGCHALEYVTFTALRPGRFRLVHFLNATVPDSSQVIHSAKEIHDLSPTTVRLAAKSYPLSIFLISNALTAVLHEV